MIRVEPVGALNQGCRVCVLDGWSGSPLGVYLPASAVVSFFLGLTLTEYEFLAWLVHDACQKVGL